MNRGSPFPWTGGEQEEPVVETDIDRISSGVLRSSSAGEPTHESSSLSKVSQATEKESMKKRKKPADPQIVNGPLESREVDFYRNPTILSRLILHQKYGAALKRVHHRRQETAAWLCVKRKRKGKIVHVLRQLPIHMACASLVRTLDPQLKEQLNELITSLIVANPKGAFCPDHDGRLPIFDAVFHGARIETISFFLMAEPSAINMVDSQTNRTLMEVNDYRTGDGKQDIKDLLSLGESFWRNAHDEAELRLRAGNKGVKYPSTDSHVSSIVPLGSDEAENSTIVTAESDITKLKEADTDNDSIPPISWSQLEKRAICMEQCVTEMNEKNYLLNKRLADVSQGRHLSNEVTALHQENLELSEKLQALQEIMARTVGMPGEHDEESTLGGIGRSATLPQKYEVLYKRHKAQRESIFILQSAFAALVTSQSDEVSEYTPGGGTGRASSITWSDLSSQEYDDSRHSFQERSKPVGTSSGEVSAEPRRQSAKGTPKELSQFFKENSLGGEVQWTPENPRQSTYMEIDTLSTIMKHENEESLSVIFRTAAKGSSPRVTRPLMKPPPPPSEPPPSDNLSTLLQQAARSEGSGSLPSSPDSANMPLEELAVPSAAVEDEALEVVKRSGFRH